MIEATGLNYITEVTFSGMMSLLSFLKNTPVGLKVDRGDTHREKGDIISLLFPQRKKVGNKLHLMQFYYSINELFSMCVIRTSVLLEH
jgi:hypothetical protein